MNLKTKLWLSRLAPLIGLLFGLILSCLLAIFFNENPFKIFKILSTGFYSSPFDLGLTLYYTTCFIFSGLAFSIPFRAGLFNIGAEGQILFSGFMAAAFAQATNTHSIFLVFLITILTTTLWSFLMAIFKIYRQAHEVVVAIMLNYILSTLTTFWTVQYFQNSLSQNPETALLNSSLTLTTNDIIKKYFDNSPVSFFLLISLAIAVVVFIFENKTTWGLKLKAFGQNQSAAIRMDFSRLKIYSGVMIFAGTMSACIGLTEVFGNSNQFKVGFSPQIGFIGIAVSILARQNALGIIFSAFLFACLHKGASDLDIDSEFLTRDFSKVVQALIIFSVASAYFIIPKLINYRSSKRTIQ